jgi:hypothetical protein
LIFEEQKLSPAGYLCHFKKIAKRNAENKLGRRGIQYFLLVRCGHRKLKNNAVSRISKPT